MDNIIQKFPQFKEHIKLEGLYTFKKDSKYPAKGILVPLKSGRQLSIKVNFDIDTGKPQLMIDISGKSRGGKTEHFNSFEDIIKKGYDIGQKSVKSENPFKS